MAQITNILKNPLVILAHMTRFIKDDKLFLQLQYLCYVHKFLNLKNPKTYNEKIQWLKLYNRNPLYTSLVDKVEVKKYVDDILGPGHTFPLLGSWEKPEDIEWDKLPNEFVLKCNHNSAVGMAICKDKVKGLYTKAHGGDKIFITKDQVIEGLHEGLAQNFYLGGREWPYKNVKPRIIAEKFMSNDNSNSINNTDLPSDLIDYKFYCFNGKPELLYVSKGLENHKTARISFLSLDWKFAPYCRTDYTPFEDLPLMPENYNKMIELAKLLSAGHSFLRVDLYEVNKHVYFSELTFSPCSGFLPFGSREQDNMMGSLLKLNTGDF